MLTGPPGKGVFLLFLCAQASTGRLAGHLALIWSLRTRVFPLFICFGTMKICSAPGGRSDLLQQRRDTSGANLRVNFLKGPIPNG